MPDDGTAVAVADQMVAPPGRLQFQQSFQQIMAGLDPRPLAVVPGPVEDVAPLRQSCTGGQTLAQFQPCRAALLPPAVAFIRRAAGKGAMDQQDEILIGGDVSRSCRRRARFRTRVHPPVVVHSVRVNGSRLALAIRVACGGVRHHFRGTIGSGHRIQLAPELSNDLRERNTLSSPGSSTPAQHPFVSCRPMPTGLSGTSSSVWNRNPADRSKTSGPGTESRRRRRTALRSR